MLIDTHVHIYPGPADLLHEEMAPPAWAKTGAELIEAVAKGPQAQINRALQAALPKFRDLPKPLLPLAEKLHGAASIGGTLLESSKSALLESMDKNGIDIALAIAHPRLISNDFILNACVGEPRLFPVVNIPPSAKRPKTLLLEYKARGAVALKIHAAADGMGANDSHYLQLLELADQEGLPVIIHTGCIHIQPFYKEPEMGHAFQFRSWFSRYPQIKFTLAHMNYHYPREAIELCEQYQNVYCDISWQPASIIVEAVARIPEKIMFGSDWPLVGSNHETMVARLKTAEEETGQLDQLRFQTAKKVFAI